MFGLLLKKDLAFFKILWKLYTFIKLPAHSCPPAGSQVSMSAGSHSVHGCAALWSLLLRSLKSSGLLLGCFTSVLSWSQCQAYPSSLLPVFSLHFEYKMNMGLTSLLQPCLCSFLLKTAERKWWLRKMKVSPILPSPLQGISFPRDN